MCKQAVSSSSNLFTPWPEADANRYRTLGLWLNKNMFHILSDSRVADKLAVIDDNKQLTYGQLKTNSLALAQGLYQLGIRTGDNVVLQLPNRIEFVETLFALFALGAVPVMALPAHREQELKHFCAESQAVAYICADQAGGFDYRALARNVCALTQLKHVFVAGDGQEFYSLDDVKRAGELGAKSKASLPVEDNGQSLALLQLSGGTTNLPKLIPRTHDDYFYSVRESAAVTGLTNESVYLCVLPAAHNFTLSSAGVLGALYAGATVILSEHVAPDRVLPIIAKQRVTTVALVPPLANAWLQFAQKNRVDTNSLQVVQVGGAKLISVLAKQIVATFNCKLQQVFGMAEGLVNYTRLHDGPDKTLFTQGCPLSSEDEIKVVADDDTPVANGEVGHLLTRGPYTIRGYYNAPEHNATAFTPDGFYRTGDLVRLTEEGYVVVEGRAKDQINRGGEKISAAELEELLVGHPGLADAAVVAMKDSVLGEKTCAFVIKSKQQAYPQGVNAITNQQTITLPALRRYLRDIGVAEYKLPDRVVCVDAFPTTKFGKVSKKALRETLENIQQLA